MSWSHISRRSHASMPGRGRTCSKLVAGLRPTARGSRAPERATSGSIRAPWRSSLPARVSHSRTSRPGSNKARRRSSRSPTSPSISCTHMASSPHSGHAASGGELHRVLRPGGTALVMVYHRDSLNYRFTIMALRRALAATLLVPGAAKAIARLTGESSDVLLGQRELLRRHGLRYLTDRELFLSNNTDGPGNPLVEGVFASRRARSCSRTSRRSRLRCGTSTFASSRRRRTRAHEPRARARPRIGWHLYIRATRD